MEGSHYAEAFTAAGGGYAALARRLHGTKLVSLPGGPDSSPSSTTTGVARARRASAPELLLAGVPQKALEPKVFVPLEAADLLMAASASGATLSSSSAWAGIEVASLKARRRASLGPICKLGGLVPLTLASPLGQPHGLGTNGGSGSGSPSPALAAAATYVLGASLTTSRTLAGGALTRLQQSEPVPRRVEVERRKRANIAAHSDLQRLLAEAGVPPILRTQGDEQTGAPTPPSVSGGSSGDAGSSAPASPVAGTGTDAPLRDALSSLGLTAVTPSHLPLHAFDDGASEVRSPSSWIERGVATDEEVATGGTAVRAGPGSSAGGAKLQRGVPGQALDTDGLNRQWRACRAVGYDAARDEFVVVWATSREGGADVSGDAAASAAKGAPHLSDGSPVIMAPNVPSAHGWASVPRLHLCFYAESPADFASRVGRAWAARSRAASVLAVWRLLQAVTEEAAGADAAPLPTALLHGALSYLAASLTPHQQSGSQAQQGQQQQGAGRPAGGASDVQQRRGSTTFPGAPSGSAVSGGWGRLSLASEPRGPAAALLGSLLRRASLGGGAEQQPAASSTATRGPGPSPSTAARGMSGASSVPPSVLTSLQSHPSLALLLEEVRVSFNQEVAHSGWAAWLSTHATPHGTAGPMTVGRVRGLTVPSPVPLHDALATAVAAALGPEAASRSAAAALAPRSGKVDLQLQANHAPVPTTVATGGRAGPSGGALPPPMRRGSGAGLGGGAASLLSGSAVERPPYDYAGTRDALRFAFLYTKPEAVTAMARVNGENLRLLGCCVSGGGGCGSDSAPRRGGGGDPSTSGGGGASGAPLFVTAALTKPHRPDEFEHVQSASQAAFSAFLRDGWAAGCKNGVRLALADVGKGHFNLRELDATAYEYSKLRRLLRAAHARMEDSLRLALTSAAREYAGTIEHACGAGVKVTSSHGVTLSYPPGFAPRRSPLFALDVVVVEEGSAGNGVGDDGSTVGGVMGRGVVSRGSRRSPSHYGTAAAPPPSASAPSKRVFAFSTHPETLASLPVAVFDRGLKVAGGIPQIERAVMDRLFWPSDPLITPVHPSEPAIATLRGRIATAMASAVAPLTAYLRTLEPHLPAANLDVEARIASLRAKWTGAGSEEGAGEAGREGSAGEGGSASPDIPSPDIPAATGAPAISSGGGGGNTPRHASSGTLPSPVVSFGFLPEARAMIAAHRKASLDVLSSVPPTVSLGIAQVSLGEVRASISRKHAALADAVVRLVASLVTEAAGDVIRAYDAIIKTLSLAPCDVESLTALRGFISGVPGKVASLQARMGALADGYELLDEACFTLPREQVDQRWRAEGGAVKVGRKLAETALSLDRDATRYAAKMEAEQTEFAESLTSLREEVGALSSTFTRLEDAPEALRAVTKLRLALEDAETRSKVFSAREALFNRSQSSYEALGEARKAFEPFLSLWETASAWSRNHASWMGDPLTTLNAEAIERDAGNAGRAMAKVIKVLERLASSSAAAGGTAAGGSHEADGGSTSHHHSSGAFAGPLSVARAVRDEVDAFKPFLPLITALRNPGMRTRHWDELSSATGVDIHPIAEDEGGEAGTAAATAAADGSGAGARTVATANAAVSRGKDAKPPSGSSGSGSSHWDLSRVIGAHLLDQLETVTRVCERAGKEFQIESALDKMVGEWEEVTVTLISYRDTGTFLLRGVDVLQALLDEHTQTTQAMGFSAFKKPFAERIDAWGACLTSCSDVLEEWLRLQRSFLYLQPIFASEDIQRQLPVEYKRFASADKTWRAAMLAAKGNGGPPALPPAQAAAGSAPAAAAAPQPFPGVKALPLCNNPKLRDRFAEANRLLELVQKGLADYLALKRGVMPRFFFLSDAELLEILSQARDPQAVQPHLRKCFEGVARVEFGASAPGVNGAAASSTIVSMQSGEKEVIALTNPVDTRGKAVESWLLEFERAMAESVRSQMRDALVDYAVAPRPEWVQKWPGQCVIAGSQVYWTHETEEAIRACTPAPPPQSTAAGAEDDDAIAVVAAADAGGGSIAPLQAAYERQLAQLQEMVVLIRGRLSPLARITLGALTVIDVHARDVTRRLIENHVCSVSDFEWTSQMRLYWKLAAGGATGASVIADADGVPSDAPPIDIAPDGALVARMVSAERKYAYEYLGNSPRLVITPLTDKCYLTLMGAMQMMLGGAPAGPAGTGKTETVKDLAKCLANYCVVFNCSDQMSVESTAKFFKGLVSTGAWACFDEFNRIDIEVLSVVAQQVLCVQEAVRAGRSRMIFEGTDIPVNPDYAAFITMNPGYAGRSELPDNLKALFRPCAMMVPDYGLISEISLFSYGYSHALPLARKIVALLKLCSEQLSSQDWYDYGMRAVKTIIVAAGNLKAAQPDADEEALLYRALRDVNEPKFVSADLPLFQGIMSDLFPSLALARAAPASAVIALPAVAGFASASVGAAPLAALSPVSASADGSVDASSDNAADASGGDFYAQLTSAIITCARAAKLQPVPHFVTKCIQLYDIIVVRHGIMTVGPTGGGKSSMLRVVRDALTLLASRGVDAPKVAPVHIHALNPKAVTMGQLYGAFDPATREWTDGVLAEIVRQCVRCEPPDLNWVLCDGPVDAIWIESMNTVLDDNKKLCLVSGEIIALSPQTTMIFEVADLAVASPATVSRCGMVYTEPSALGIDVLLTSWYETLPPAFGAETQAALTLLVEALLRPLLAYLRRGGATEAVPTTDNMLTRSLLNILDVFLEPFLPKEGRDGPSKEALASLAAQLPGMFLFALTWSAGATTSSEGRRKLNGHIHELCSKASAAHPGLRLPLPQHSGGDQGSELPLLHDYAWDASGASGGGGNGGGWVPWMTTVPAYEMPRGVDFSELLVPTKDSVRHKWLARSLLTHKRAFVLTGDTGAGKTVQLAELLASGMPPEFTPLQTTFSAQTSANQTQDLVDGKLEKRSRGTFGPPAGSTFVFFVDDLNMPAREQYGAQPPLELLRQLADYGGWYDRKERAFRRVIDTTLLAAMGPPGGGRNPISARLVRHFHMVNATPQDSESMASIFNTLLGNTLANGGFAEPVRALAPGAVAATIRVYSTLVDQLLPTPSKPHYTFNLRDMSRHVQGLCAVSDPKVLPGAGDFARLWVHEARRVFADRLISDADRTWFDDQLRGALAADMGLQWGDIVQGDDAGAGSGGSGPIFVDFLIPGADPKLYREVVPKPAPAQQSSDASPATTVPAASSLSAIGSLKAVVEDYLGEYNAESKVPLKLVLFGDALEHVARITRILRQPQGNALLLGVGGSGRQSLTRLAAFIAGYSLSTIELTKNYGREAWREDVKRVLLRAGVEDKPVVFLFSDTHIVFEAQLEDVGCMLNSGDVPSLYAPEDLEAIYAVARPECVKRRIPPTKVNMMAQYVLRVRRNLHVVLAMSPAGDAFRSRLRAYPALVNCTTIDYFSEWPPDALRAVGTSLLGDAPRELGLGPHLRSLVEFFARAHVTMSEAAGRYLASTKRYTAVTPTSFLELLATFQAVLGSRQGVVGTRMAQLRTGLDKIAQTEAVVATLQGELVALQPVLAVTQTEVAAMIVQLTTDKASAAETKAMVEREEAEATRQAGETKAIADDAQADLDKALPALEAAVECLDKLKKSDLDELKALRTPPRLVKLTLQAACVMFGVKPKVIPDPDNPGKKMKDWWSAAQQSVLQDAKKLVADLKGFDKDNIPADVIAEIEPFMADPEFTFEAVDKSSKACSGICLWVRAMHTYHGVALNVEPKKRALAEAQTSLDATMSQLAGVKARLAEVEANIAALEASYTAAAAKQTQLATDVALCAARLGRAQTLIGGLGGEKTRWGAQVETLSGDYGSLVGDCAVAACSIAYCGAFDAPHRWGIVSQLRGCLATLALPHSPDCGLVQTLGDPVTIRSWQAAGLPSDTHSSENGLIIARARRWPLFIDPQGQANRFIRALGRDTSVAPNGLEILRPSDRRFLQTVENALRFGKWLLIEGLPEGPLDAALEPVLTRQTFKQGGAECIRLGDAVVPYSGDFRLIMTSPLPNPSYPPETQTKVTLINAVTTPGGLEEQLLGVLMATELPQLESRKAALVVSNAKSRSTLAGLQDRILSLLSSSSGNILDDTELIATLADSQTQAAAIAVSVAEAEATEAELDAVRERYRPVAVTASRLFFALSETAGWDPMYAFSLEWFTALFVSSIRDSAAAGGGVSAGAAGVGASGGGTSASQPEVAAAIATDAPASSSEPAAPSDGVAARIVCLNAHFTYAVYASVARSLFERHKPLWSFLLAVRVALPAAGIPLQDDAWRFMLAGQAPGTPPPPLPNPCSDWLSDRMWGEMRCLSCLPGYGDLPRSLVAEPTGALAAGLKALWGRDDAHAAPLPAPYGEAEGTPAWGALHRLLLLRCLRPDKLLPGMRAFVVTHLGPAFTEPPPFDLASSYAGSSPTAPLLFLLSSGSDPTRAFYTFAESRGMRASVRGISLGQGQGPAAAKLIEEAAAGGGWVLLQNCHLASSWMPSLERIVEGLASNSAEHPPHPDFRLWLTSSPSKSFPVPVLQNAVKMTLEPPKGLRSNLRGFFHGLSDESLAACASKPVAYRRLLFGLATFHAVVQERRRFGPLGWSIPYAFNESDLAISVDQLRLFLESYEDVPYTVLHRLVSVVNYGGRVTDDKDARTLDVILRRFLNPGVVQTPGHALTASGAYSIPLLPQDDGTEGGAAASANSGSGVAKALLAHVEALPIEADPDVFGLHPNANVSADGAEAEEALAALLALDTSASSSSTAAAPDAADAAAPADPAAAAPIAAAPAVVVRSREDIIGDTARDIGARVPTPFDEPDIATRYPVRYEESLNTVLQQEAARYNRLLRVVASSLREVQRALKGLVVMSKELEDTAAALFDGRVPPAWEAVAYPSLKPLGPWVADLLDRCAYISGWIATGPPHVQWLSAVFFPQALLTAVLQNHARQHGLPIDSLSFSFAYLPDKAWADITASPPQGVYVRGMYLEGARFDGPSGGLANSLPRQLHTPLPVIHLVPTQGKGGVVGAAPGSGVYRCPVYRTLARYGVLATTGHSSNFVCTIEVPAGPSGQPITNNTGATDDGKWIAAGVAAFLALKY